MMVSKETQAPNELPMCEAPIFPSPLIHPSAWNGHSRKFVTLAHRTVLVTVAVALRRR
jgi:hypothetical protein